MGKPCPKCNRISNRDANFCSECGYSFLIEVGLKEYHRRQLEELKRVGFTHIDLPTRSFGGRT